MTLAVTYSCCPRTEENMAITVLVWLLKWKSSDVRCAWDLHFLLYCVLKKDLSRKISVQSWCSNRVLSTERDSDVHSFFNWKASVPSRLSTSIAEMKKIKSTPSSSPRGNDIGKELYAIRYHKCYSKGLSQVKGKVKGKGIGSPKPWGIRIELAPRTILLFHRETGDRWSDSKWGWEIWLRPCLPC